jgi:hypothetical protein
MIPIKKYPHGGVHYDLPEEPLTRREKHAENVENRNIKRWKRRYKNYVKRNPEKKGDHAAELYATKPWLNKDKRQNFMEALRAKMKKIGLCRDKVTGGVDAACKNPTWSG